MSSTIWDLATSETGTSAGDMAPYAATGGNNYYELFHNSQRTSRKTEHALNHCLAMAQYYRDHDNIPLSCDWAIAAASHADNDSAFLPALLNLWSPLCDTPVHNWPELFTAHRSQLTDRLLSVTLIRIYMAVRFTLGREHNIHFLGFARTHCPDIFQRAQLKDKKDPEKEIEHLRSLNEALATLLRPIREATEAQDIRAVLQRVHPAIRSLNDNFVRGMMNPHLPQSFTKTTLPAVFNAIKPFDGPCDNRFIDNVDLARTEIAAATKALVENDSYFGRLYLLPLLQRLNSLVDREYALSDATKPARLTLKEYDRKYPFHMSGAKTRLRFVLENHGPGPARDIEISVMLLAKIEPEESKVWISELTTGHHSVELNVVVGELIGEVEYHADVAWTNFDGTVAEYKCSGFLQWQSIDVDWDTLSSADHYSIEAISLNSERPFVGREADVQAMLRSLTGRTMGSFYIYGQKRVGKTSLALEVISRIESTQKDFAYIYLEGGDYVRTTPEGVMQSLGRQIARSLQRSKRQLEHIPLPDISDSLSPLNEFVDEVLAALPTTTLLLVLDEFDELPLELYKRGPIGDGFFLTLRALGGRPRIGIVLIGGEKMGPILAAQGDQLNRFSSLRVDYFSREDHWNDFQELVRAPVRGAIDISDAAVECIYRWSAGNPYFTNVICKRVLERCCERRDAFVSELEVEECARLACNHAGAPSFQHFWEDGVLDTGTNTEEVSIRRRRVLLALATALRAGSGCSQDNLAQQRDLISMTRSSLDSELKRFVERRVLLEQGGEYRCRVYMFEQFLVERSAELISTEFTDRDERIVLEQEENDAYVHSSELTQLIKSWGTYCSTPVSEERVRAWLSQFGPNKDQRVMFQMLKALRFYSEEIVREKLRSAMNFVRRHTVEVKREGERSRRDILVSHLGGIAKSGPQFARMFCQENKIVRENAIGWEAIREKLRLDGEPQAVVMIEDIIGTGGTAVESLKSMNEQMGNELRSSRAKVFLVVICGFSTALESVEKTAEELHLPVEVWCSDILDERDRAFSEGSVAFGSNADRLRARQLAYERGELLEKKWPLGHGDSEALVVFFGNCPNNTLPIIYKNSTDWRALFLRR